MDTNSIYNILYTLFKRRAQIAVLGADQLDAFQIIKYPVCLCVNSDPISKPGQHWVGIYIKNVSGPLEFFCSYGLGIMNYVGNFKKFVKKCNLSVLENRKRLQSASSNVCGLYVIYYLYKRMNGCCPRSFYYNFSSNYENNDKIVKHMVKIHKNLLIIRGQSCCTFEQNKSKF